MRVVSVFVSQVTKGEDSSDEIVDIHKLLNQDDLLKTLPRRLMKSASLQSLVDVDDISVTNKSTPMTKKIFTIA